MLSGNKNKYVIILPDSFCLIQNVSFLLCRGRRRLRAANLSFFGHVEIVARVDRFAVRRRIACDELFGAAGSLFGLVMRAVCDGRLQSGRK